MQLISLLVMSGVSVLVVNQLLRQETAPSTSSKTLFSVQQQLGAQETTDFEELARVAQAAGGALYVVADGGLVFSSGDEEMDDLRALQVSSQVAVFEQEDELVMSRQMSEGGQDYQLYIVFEEWDDWSERIFFQHFVVQFAMIGGAALLVILAVNAWFTGRLWRAITRPIDQLHQAVQRVQSGEYETEIDYRGDQEFEELTQGFNQMQASLRSSTEQNRLYERNRTQMVADISHDLRTPLTSIKGYAKGMMDGVAATPEKVAQYVQTIYTKSQTMEKLLDKLLLFSQLETDKLPFQLTTVDVRQLLVEYAAEKEKEWLDMPISLDVDAQSSLLFRVDVVQFRRILDNLVDNAIKYASVTPLQLKLRAVEDNHQVVICFADNGKGVPEDQLPHLFEEFYRIDPARQTVGHGLGLSIVWQITQRLGGRVQVSNQEGLRFTFYFPKEGA